MEWHTVGPRALLLESSLTDQVFMKFCIYGEIKEMRKDS